MKLEVKVGLVICNSGASNNGHITGLAAVDVVKSLGSGNVGICSLPALANKIPRQTALVKRIKHLVVIDGCHNECSRKILDALGIKYDNYINLEYDLEIKKSGPFTTLKYSEDEVKKVSNAILEKIKVFLNE